MRAAILSILFFTLARTASRGADIPAPADAAALSRPPYAAQQSAFDFSPEVAYESRAVPGGLIRIRARFFSGIDRMSAYLCDQRGRRIARASFFRTEAKKESAWAGFLGVPSTARAGEYLLVVNAERESRSFFKAVAVFLEAKKFASERIPIDGTLTGLLETADPAKIEEGRELAELLSRAHPDAVFERGMLRLPVVPLRKSAGFGDRREYRGPGSRADFSVHNGIDYALAEGSPVSACGKGMVVMAKKRILTGNTVVLEHLPGLYSLYFHLSEIAVKEGETVEKGGLVGKVGHTGFATGPHLHWELEALGVAVDPEPFLTAPILDKTANFDSIESSTEGR